MQITKIAPSPVEPPWLARRGRPMADDIRWTAREALACAYCWAEFSHPEDRGDTPEQYWAAVAPRARMECRTIADRLMLLRLVRGAAVPLPIPAEMSPSHLAAFAEAISLKSASRIDRILRALFVVLKPERSIERPHVHIDQWKAGGPGLIKGTGDAG